MKREIHYPEDEATWLALREEDLTSTQVPCLYNVGFRTEYELWNNKKGTLPDQFEATERTEIGKAMEQAIAKYAAVKYNWKIQKMNAYIRLPEYRLAASFDYRLLNEDTLIEVKNVDGFIFKENWVVEDGELIEAPVGYEFQVQTQMGVAGKKKSKLVAMVGGNRLMVLERDFDPKIFEAIKIKSVEFWKSIESGQPPEPDLVRDSKTISLLYGSATKGKILEVGTDPFYSDLIKNYIDWRKQKKLADDHLKAIKSQILMKVGDAAKIVGDGYSVSMGEIKKDSYTVAAQSYRDFRVFEKKVKKK